jgi:cellulose synthase/poly-beta-1,6-N-acetylglucosamine synthase-like glycosyltransferase
MFTVKIWSFMVTVWHIFRDLCRYGLANVLQPYDPLDFSKYRVPLNQNAMKSISKKSVISIIIPTFNEESSLAATLESVLTEENIEVFVSDGGSTDSTREIVNAFPTVRLITGNERGCCHLSIFPDLSLFGLFIY